MDNHTYPLAVKASPFQLGPAGEVPPFLAGLFGSTPMTIDDFHRNLAIVMLNGYPISELANKSPSYDYRRLWIILQAFCINTLPGHWKQALRMTIDKYCRVEPKTGEIHYQPQWAALEFLVKDRDDYVRAADEHS